jgi:hypothetical protein
MAISSRIHGHKHQTSVERIVEAARLRAIFGRVLEHSIPPYTVFEATKISPRYANAT